MERYFYLLIFYIFVVIIIKNLKKMERYFYLLIFYIFVVIIIKNSKK